MSEILELARRLGKAICDSPQAAALRNARKALDADTETGKLLKDYRDHAEKIAGLEHENKPVEVNDKHKLRNLQDKLLACPSFKTYTAAQVEYVNLMRKVNEELSKQLGDTEPAED